MIILPESLAENEIRVKTLGPQNTEANSQRNTVQMRNRYLRQLKQKAYEKIPSETIIKSLNTSGLAAYTA
ncbi:MAG: hypothetical protein ABI778_04245 [Ignavibacteriota bacterium]